MQKSTATNRSQGLIAPSVNSKGNRQQQTSNSVRTAGGLSSSHVSSAKQRVLDKQKSLPRIADEFGNDVTPKPLFDSELASKARHTSSLFQSLEGTSTPTDLLSTGSILGTNIVLTGGQSFTALPDSATHLSSDSAQHQTDSLNDANVENDKEAPALFFTTIEMKKMSSTLENVQIKETSTFFLLDIPATCVSNEETDVEFIKRKNEKYLELCKNKLGNDSFAERAMNTFNFLPKTKNTQTERITISEKGAISSNSDMYDSYNTQKHEDDSKVNLSGNKVVDIISRPTSQTSASTSKISISQRATVFSEASTSMANLQEELSKPTINNDYHNNDNFRQNAFFMERLINQNIYQPKQARYRGMVSISNNQEETTPKTGQQYDGPSLEKLWTYSSILTKDRNVSCLTWNKKNPDILAAGYGKFEYNEESEGLVCCWCLKNPEFPERYYKTDSGVTAVSFSEIHANLLAVGLFNGNILVFDVRNNNTVPLLTTNETENKHLSSIWQLKWTDRDRTNAGSEEGEMEVLMSISTDGRVTQWMIRKGFESTDYLKLKRVLNKQTAQKKEKEKADGFISRHVGGLCFDVWNDDKSIYLCGTEEGLIHKCSVSYNEQYLFTYEGHSGPIYKLTWSPFSRDVFLSSSGDWSIRLWKAEKSSACMTFNSANKPVYDISWSHTSSTVFCCVNETAIELWDLSKNILDPIYVANPMAPTKLTTVSFAPNSNSIVVGTNDGSLWVYVVKNPPTSNNKEILESIIKQSILTEVESDVQFDEEAKEAIERHQIESIRPHEDTTNNDDEDKKKQLDAFEAKLDNIRKEHEKSLHDKEPEVTNKLKKLLDEKSKNSDKAIKSKNEIQDLQISESSSEDN